MRPDSARTVFAVLAIAIGSAGCVSRLDMTTAYDAGRAATTIPYGGVRGARQFTDYESIGRSILTGVDPAASGTNPKSTPKPGKSKGGSK